MALVRFYGDVYPRILNTPFLLLLAHGAVSIPYMYWALDNNMRAINARSLYEAGATLGARWDQTLPPCDPAKSGSRSRPVECWCSQARSASSHCRDCWSAPDGRRYPSGRRR
jgi:hypothetical protein